MEEQKDLITGVWKFVDKVGLGELEKIAEEWAKDENVKQLYIRKVSKDQYGIGFSLVYDGSKKAYDKFFCDTSDMLKRKFGNDLAGWDIAATTYTIKGF